MVKERSLILADDISRQVFDDISWIATMDLVINYWPDSDWTVTKETIARGLLSSCEVRIDSEVRRSVLDFCFNLKF